jgi:transcriptional regulator with XRE-family HTH domain
MELASFVKEKRKSVNLTQPELAVKAGVGLRFVRKLAIRAVGIYRSTPNTPAI